MMELQPLQGHTISHSYSRENCISPKQCYCGHFVHHIKKCMYSRSHRKLIGLVLFLMVGGV